MTKIYVWENAGHYSTWSSALPLNEFNSTAMKRTIIIISILALTACSPDIRVYSDHDPDYQMKQFKTFDWGQQADIETNGNPLYYNELNDKRIKSAILKELSSRGYVRTDADPDLVIHYHIIIDDQSVITTEPFGYFYGPYWMRMRTDVYSYREGTLIIDLMDTKTKNLVWRGWATAAIDMIPQEQTEEIINRAIAKIFRRFPASTRRQEPVASTDQRF